MSITFAKAPLVEIIAEVRWPVSTQIQIGPAGIEISSGTQEQFYAEFSDMAAHNGYPRSERLLPPGFPVETGRAVWRFRPVDGATLWQVGSGVFTANAVPPYKSWDEFRPHLRTGIELMLKARRGKEHGTDQLTTVSLRYVDAFGPELTQGMPMVDFLCAKFGFELKLPDPIVKDVDHNFPIELNTKFEFQLKNGMRFGMSIAPGTFQNEPSLMVTTGVFKATPTDSNLDAIMGVFESAHTIIHDTFFDMTRSLHARMQIEGGK